MIQWNPQGDYPEIDKTAYVDSSAVIIGKVTIGRNVFVAPGAVIRVDEPKSSVIIGDNCNIQDRVIIHALGGSSVVVGENSSLSHGCIVHGPCSIGKECFIGFGSIIFRADIKEGVFVKFMALISGVTIPAKSIIPDAALIDSQEKAGALGSVPGESVIFAKNVLKSNVDLVKGYRLEKYQRPDDNGLDS